jgi:hypothetical protein
MKTKYDIVRELTEAGKSSKEIAEETGFKLHTVHQYRTLINSINKATKIEAVKDHNKDRNLCKTCIYRSREEAVNKCDYILFIGHSRGCAVEDCDKYIKGRRSDGHMRTLFR